MRDLSDHDGAADDFDRPDALVGRRTMLRGVMAGGAAMAGATVLAACGDESDPAADATPSPTEQQSDPEGEGEPPKAEALVATSDVPYGGGVILTNEEVVVTQPSAGEFACFSSICTHQGCEVGDVAGGTINCPCHGSQFSIADGSVVTGPATAPLEVVPVVVEGDSVVRA
jgi:Rieske Fe-S protein